MNKPEQMNTVSVSLAAALDRFRTIVGAEWVYTHRDDVSLYDDAFTPFAGEQKETHAAASVAPASTEEVQQVVLAANEHRIPLYPISTGRNLAYGGSAPVLSGSVILDLKRMDRILKVSEDNAFALVEPGVTYFDLYRHIRERGLKLWIDCPDTGWGSFIGNALDHGAGMTQLPFKDHFSARCGMEVVLGDGRLVRTGMGALPDSKLWQQSRYAAGPLVEGIFSQSNFGVVTKMGFWLMPEPEAVLSARVIAPKHDDVVPLVKILARLIYSGEINCYTNVRSPVFSQANDDEGMALWRQDDGGRAEQWDAYAEKLDSHFWQIPLRFYGAPDVIRAQWANVSRQFKEIAGVTTEPAEMLQFPLSDSQISELSHLSYYGIPSLAVFTGIAMDKDFKGHLDASVVVPMDGNEILKASRVFRRLYDDAGLPQVMGFAEHYHTRTMIMFQGLYLNHDPEHNANVRRTYSRIVRTAAEHGWGIYRTHIGFMDEVMETYSFNDHALRGLHESMKDALDPRGILSAGRYGIWPKHIRGRRTP